MTNKDIDMDLKNWGSFASSATELAQFGEELLYQYGIGLGYIATVRKDGGPRLHPCCPILFDDRLFVFILPNSPKRFDLDRDGRYAIHSNPCADNDDEFYFSGRAKEVKDTEIRSSVSSAAKHDVSGAEILYELYISRALHTTWLNPRQPNTEPVYSKWVDDT